MADSCIPLNRVLVLVLFCVAIIQFTASSPTRRQSVPISETSSVEPAASTSIYDAWENSDDFDLEGEVWLKDPNTPSSLSPDFADYDDYADDDDNLVMDGEEDDGDNDVSKSGFLFLTPKGTTEHQDDEDDDSHIKVRHTGKYAFSRNMNDDDDDEDDNSPHRTKDDDDIVFERRRGDEDHSDDHILPVIHRHDEDDNHIEGAHNNDRNDIDDDDNDDHILAVPSPEVHHHSRGDDDNIDDEDDNNSVEDDDDNVFDSPEEEAADVIYGDHVFLY